MPKTIPDKAYQELEEVVGPDNISVDPVILETYAYMKSAGQGGTGIYWLTPPVGVILPKSTAEVQKIIEICIKYHLRFKAHATAWSFPALAGSANVILMDMRRMNKLEINERDLYAITETYVTAGETQVEVMKRGLNPHLVGAGPNASNLASGTSMQGTGGTSVRTSMNERNILAVEWILPTGEILKLGSLNTPNAGWFCGDGPGPSLRGMMRGSLGGVGGNGVFTKAALKLYPWYGPPYKCGGEPPFFDSEEIPHSYLRYVVWPSHDDTAEGLYQLGEAEIIDYNNRWAAGAFTSAMSTTNQEYIQMKSEGKYEEKFGKGYWTFFLHSHSERSIEYKKKAFEEIVRDTNGEIMETDVFGKRSYEIAMQNAVRAIWIAKSAFMPTGGAAGSPPMAYETIDQCFKHGLQISLAAKAKYVKQDRFLQEGDNCYACMDEDGHYVHLEHALMVEDWEPKNEPRAATIEGFINAFKAGVSSFYCAFPSSLKDMIIYLQYIKKIQQMIDPYKITDASVFAK